MALFGIPVNGDAGRQSRGLKRKLREDGVKAHTYFGQLGGTPYVCVSVFEPGDVRAVEKEYRFLRRIA